MLGGRRRFVEAAVFVFAAGVAGALGVAARSGRTAERGDLRIHAGAAEVGFDNQAVGGVWSGALAGWSAEAIAGGMSSNDGEQRAGGVVGVAELKEAGHLEAAELFVVVAKLVFGSEKKPQAAGGFRVGEFGVTLDVLGQERGTGREAHDGVKEELFQLRRGEKLGTEEVGLKSHPKTIIAGGDQTIGCKLLIVLRRLGCDRLSKPAMLPS